MSQVYLFEDGFKTLGSDVTKMRELLGGKGSGLADMTAAGLNVPPGMTILTTVCQEYYKNEKKLPSSLMGEVKSCLLKVEDRLKRKLGDPKAPLLLSVRSGAKFSMPGMMDTILNLGMNESIAEAIGKETSNPRFAWDSYRRFIQMYGNVVLGIPKEAFEHAISLQKKASNLSLDSDLTLEDLKTLATQFKEIVKKERKIEFPTDPHEQLQGAIQAVFESWNNPRAVYYRNLNKIDHNIGTAVTVQSMVFGNFDDTSGTGVCFTRNPSTGEKALFGEYLVNAQGEDVVNGSRTPKRISELERDLPAIYKELVDTVNRLERHYRDMQDIEFTVQRGELFLLQTRTGKRTTAAALKVAIDLANEGVISKQEAVLRIQPTTLNQLLLPSFDAADKEKAKQQGSLLATGLNASPGAAIGEIVFAPDEAEALALQNRKVILVRIETCPDDLPGIVPAQGVLTSRGGMTSHAAVVARGMGKPCVAGCEALKIDYERQEMTVNGTLLKKGDVISIDGSTGEIFKGAIPTKEANIGEDFKTLLSWADQSRKLGVRANADTPDDAKRARAFGAEGIGLCRTEHMFMEAERLPVMQAMIMATNLQDRKEQLAKLLPMQRADFLGLFKAMGGYPVTIRLLDPPLHEFLPKLEDLIEQIATLKANGAERSELRKPEILLQKVRSLHESNPMMGLRGCRLGLLYPEINEMQVQAIFEAAILAKKEGCDVHPEVMIPLVGHVNELHVARKQLETVAKQVMEREKTVIQYKFGTMIEIPRACVTADEIAADAEFFSFGTNDLTQMTFGYSRDDAEGKFLQRYLEGVTVNGEQTKILKDNPFEMLDQGGVGKLMRLAVAGGKATRPDLKIGICGEHGGEPSSIAFAHEIGLTYVSCSPYRVPVARLAAAHAAIATGK